MPTERTKRRPEEKTRRTSTPTRIEPTVLRRLPWSPVFCCSSCAFSKTKGNFRKEGRSSAAFKDLNATEVPQLQDHTRELTVQSRNGACASFLSGSLQLLKALTIWI